MDMSFFLGVLAVVVVVVLLKTARVVPSESSLWSSG